MIIVLNIFNNNLTNMESNLKSTEQLISTPEQETTTVTNIKQETKHLMKVIIYTNDVQYLKHACRNFISNVQIIYTLKDLTRSDNLVCLRHISDKDNKKYSSLANLKYIINIDTDGDYKYTIIKEACSNFKVEDYTSSLIEKLVQQIFIELRDKYKSIIPPKQLLNTIQALITSINNITKGKFTNKEIRQVFMSYFSRNLI